AGVGALALGAAVVAGATAAWFGEERVVHAVGEGAPDLDGDGLPDRLELVIGTLPNDGDSDGDGFSDAEELARGSNPRLTLSVPTGTSSAVGMAAYKDGNKVHAVTVVYLHDGKLRNKRLTFGARIGANLKVMPLSSLRGGDDAKLIAARGDTAKLLIVDPVVSAGAVIQRQSLSLFATLARAGGYDDAAACNLVADASGGLFEFLLPVSASGAQNGGAPVVPNVGIGGIYRPIEPGNGGPNYLMGEICAQTTVLVGVIGAVVTQEVIAADCVPGWDTYCTPGCAATVGTTVRAVDPAALIGG
ncbi:MAG: hypothetical protein HUU27_12900, partial [Phycisphaerae bacterium]|nr:hypothetical protein [Phycisphaerae bacterium]